MEKKTMLQNHSVEDNGAYLTVTLGDDEFVVTTKHLDTMNELCGYLDCLSLLTAFVDGQNHCINKQGEKISSLLKEKIELTHKIDDYQKRIDDQVSLIQRLRAVAEREYKERSDLAGELAYLRNRLVDLHDWIETVTETEEDE